MAKVLRRETEREHDNDDDDDDAGARMDLYPVGREHQTEAATSEIASEVRRPRNRTTRRGRRASSVSSSTRGNTITISGLRHKRSSTILAGRRRSPSTPVPSWKLIEDGDDAPSDAEVIKVLPEAVGSGPGHDPNARHHAGRSSNAADVSARKLAAALWELHGPSFARPGTCKSKQGHQRKHRPRANHLEPPSPAYSYLNEKLLRPPAAGHKTETFGKDAMFTNAGTDMKNNTMYGPVNSNEVVKVLNHVWSLEEQHKSSMALIASLRRELDNCHRQLQELMHNEKTHRKEVETITRKLVEERTLWQERQRESIEFAIQSIKEELHYERKSKSRLESLHKRMGRELHDVKKALGIALNDLNRERKARELMEEVCDELAREIGEDKAKVEELRRESAKVREEVEEERKMLQMAEIWREERVQMKLMEAKLELEEKNSALDKLRSELETFLKTKRASSRDESNREEVDLREDEHEMHTVNVAASQVLPDAIQPKEARILPRNSVDSQHSSGGKGNQRLQETEACDDSSCEDDELHSFEIHNGDGQWAKNLYYQKDGDNQKKWASNWQASNAEKSRLRQVGMSTGLQRTRSSQLGEIRRHANFLDDMQDATWLQNTADIDESREWAGEWWQDEKDDPQDRTSYSPRVIGVMSQQHDESNQLESSGTNAAWLSHMAETSTDLPATAMLTPMHQMYGTSSPTRQWNHFWSSLDQGSPRVSRGRDSTEIPKENTLHAKLLEAKLESHHKLRSRSGKG